MKYKNLQATIIISILLGLTSCNGEDDSKSETLDPSEEKVLSIDQIKNSQEVFLIEEIDNPDEKEPEEPEEPDEDEDVPEPTEEEEVLEDEPTEDEEEEDELQ